MTHDSWPSKERTCPGSHPRFPQQHRRASDPHHFRPDRWRDNARLPWTVVVVVVGSSTRARARRNRATPRVWAGVRVWVTDTPLASLPRPPTPLIAAVPSKPAQPDPAVRTRRCNRWVAPPELFRAVWLGVPGHGAAVAAVAAFWVAVAVFGGDSVCPVAGAYRVVSWDDRP